MALSTQEKARENRLRRMAQRQGLRLERSRRRDPRALDYGTYLLIRLSGGAIVASSADLDEIERHLLGEDDR